MTEKIRKFMYGLGNIMVIISAPFFLFIVVIGMLFNPTDGGSESGGAVILIVVYSAFVYSFYKFVRKPTEGKKLNIVMVYIVSAFILYLVLLALAYMFWK